MYRETPKQWDKKEKWLDKAVKLRKEGYSYGYIAKQLKKHFNDEHDRKVEDHIRRKVNKVILGGDAESKESKPKVEVVQNLEPEIMEQRWKGCETIRFGLMGDTQFNSKYTQITHLYDFYQLLKERGIKTVYHTGDMDEGEQMRPGHQYECYNQGADDHVQHIIDCYPKVKGITTYFITGNHDASLIKRAGYDLGRAIENARDDLVYLGRDCAVVQLTPKCTMELRHPWDGSAYAISYKTQKMIDAMSGGEKPNILAIGHYHKAEYIFYRNVHAFQTGTFQAQTPFMRGKQLSAHMGGWIIECQVDKKTGELASVKSEFIPFYSAIKDDYKNWI